MLRHLIAFVVLVGLIALPAAAVERQARLVRLDTAAEQASQTATEWTNLSVLLLAAMAAGTLALAASCSVAGSNRRRQRPVTLSAAIASARGR